MYILYNKKWIFFFLEENKIITNVIIRAYVICFALFKSDANKQEPAYV